jgi:hypothetical protein
MTVRLENRVFIFRPRQHQMSDREHSITLEPGQPQCCPGGSIRPGSA